MESETLSPAVFGYSARREFIGTEVCQLIFGYVTLRHSIGQMNPADRQVLAAPTLYGDVLTDALLQQQTAKVEQAVGCALSPTYSYVRLHGPGATLPIHLDRPACEITVSVNIGGDAPWPLWLRTDSGDVAIDLRVGDALIYEGVVIPHWREPFVGTRQVQCVLHYVRRDGPFASQKFDGRPALGMPSMPPGLRDRVRAAASRGRP